MTHRLAFYLLLAFGLAGCSLLIHGQDSGRPCDSAGACPAGFTCDSANTCQPTQLNGPPCKTDSDCLQNGNYIGRTCVQSMCLAAEGQSCTSVSCDPTNDLECLTIQGNDTCYKKCTDTKDCGRAQKCDGLQGSATLSHCIQNQCSPDDTGDPEVQLASYLGPCRAINAGDAVCVGPLSVPTSNTGSTVGLCYGTGSLNAGDACTVGASYGDSGLCGSGLCIPSKAGSTTGVCVAFCELLDGRSCDPVNGAATACGWGGFGLGGLCILQGTPPVQVGGACTLTPGIQPCVEDAACIALGDGSGQVCHQLCDRRTGAPCAGKCIALPNAPNEPLLGICHS